MGRTCGSGFPTGEPGVGPSNSEVAMGRRWSYDELVDVHGNSDGFVFTDHAIDDVVFTLTGCEQSVAELVYQALNHLCQKEPSACTQCTIGQHFSCQANGCACICPTAAGHRKEKHDMNTEPNNQEV